MSYIKKDTVLCGVKVGEHSFDADKMTDELYERVVKRGCNFVYIRTKIGELQPREDFIKWARFLTENKVYFHFGTHRPPSDSVEQFDSELVEKIKKIAGEYFLGDAISEPGTAMACNFSGYYPPSGYLKKQPSADCADMKQAHDRYVEKVRKYVVINKEIGMPNILNIEATALSKYNIEAGINLPILEMMNGNPDNLVPFIRGASRAYGLDKWGTLIAHEWYGGRRHFDMLKRKRLELAYKFAYMQGSNMIVMESGDEAVNSYDTHLTADSEICKDYRDVLANTVKFVKEDIRPKGGPKVKLAFVSGRYDAWGGFCGSSLWDQFHREEWAHGDAEHSWRILDELGTRRKWADVENFGDYDFSALPAYGAYDVVPIEEDTDALCRYEYLIFVGWNSMTDEDMDKLSEYVRRGGKLLMTAAHLNYNTKRDAAFDMPPEEKMKELFGCRFTGKTVRTNSGTKFAKDSKNSEILYPVSEDLMCDPQFSAGYAEYAEVELCGGVASGVLSDSFWKEGNETAVSVVENKLGKGTATLVTSINYPGNTAVYPFYRAMVREFVSASARNCKIKVIGSDRVRWSVYDGGKVYLLNTDYDVPAVIKLVVGETEETITLDSLELKSIQL
ncbi:MAG: beta-galactosidase trimerization domain-containing protein [Oscillospiraceae bacterium]|nr:beta-galactosidase trimerization domain-containing protein [Oscillospiraceae bacterium]MBQ9986639.1 beta-galactosidase trimerization domain-containing protein [Oscillospiraceae bacterium]